MEYSIRYLKNAEKYLDSQPTSVQKRIMDAIDGLPKGDVLKLKGRKGYRLVVGGFRVLFDYTNKTTSDGKAIIEIVTVGARGDVYKK